MRTRTGTRNDPNALPEVEILSPPPDVSIGDAPVRDVRSRVSRGWMVAAGSLAVGALVIYWVAVPARDSSGDHSEGRPDPTAVTSAGDVSRARATDDVDVSTAPFDFDSPRFVLPLVGDDVGQGDMWLLDGARVVVNVTDPVVGAVEAVQGFLHAEGASACCERRVTVLATPRDVLFDRYLTALHLDLADGSTAWLHATGPWHHLVFAAGDSTVVVSASPGVPFTFGELALYGELLTVTARRGGFASLDARHPLVVSDVTALIRIGGSAGVVVDVHGGWSTECASVPMDRPNEDRTCVDGDRVVVSEVGPVDPPGRSVEVHVEAPGSPVPTTAPGAGD